MNDILLYISGPVLLFWGLAHIIKTNPAVNSFGQLSVDNKRIVIMEWVSEGLLIVFIGVFAIVGSLIGLQSVIFWLPAAALLIMAVLSLATGARTSLIQFRLCPVIFSVCALLIVAGVLL